MYTIIVSYYLSMAPAWSPVNGGRLGWGRDKQLKALSTKCRHFKITSFWTFHFLKRTVTPQLRNSAEFVFLHRCPDETLLRQLHEEALSLWVKRDDFLDVCRDVMMEDYPCMVLHRDKALIDVKGQEWLFIKKQKDLILKTDSKVSKKKKKNVKKCCVEVDTEQDDTEYCGPEPEVQESACPEIDMQAGRRLHPRLTQITNFKHFRIR